MGHGVASEYSDSFISALAGAGSTQINDELTAVQWALNSGAECCLHTALFNTFNNLTRLPGPSRRVPDLRTKLPRAWPTARLCPDLQPFSLFRSPDLRGLGAIRIRQLALCYPKRCPDCRQLTETVFSNAVHE
jgi:hypothetical protein